MGAKLFLSCLSIILFLSSHSLKANAEVEEFLKPFINILNQEAIKWKDFDKLIETQLLDPATLEIEKLIEKRKAPFHHPSRDFRDGLNKVMKERDIPRDVLSIEDFTDKKFHVHPLIEKLEKRYNQQTAEGQISERDLAVALMRIRIADSPKYKRLQIGLERLKAKEGVEKLPTLDKVRENRNKRPEMEFKERRFKVGDDHHVKFKDLNGKNLLSGYSSSEQTNSKKQSNPLETVQGDSKEKSSSPPKESKQGVKGSDESKAPPKGKPLKGDKKSDSTSKEEVGKKEKVDKKEETDKKGATKEATKEEPINKGEALSEDDCKKLINQAFSLAFNGYAQKRSDALFFKIAMAIKRLDNFDEDKLKEFKEKISNQRDKIKNIENLDELLKAITDQDKEVLKKEENLKNLSHLFRAILSETAEEDENKLKVEIDRFEMHLLREYYIGEDKKKPFQLLGSYLDKIFSFGSLDDVEEFQTHDKIVENVEVSLKKNFDNGEFNESYFVTALYRAMLDKMKERHREADFKRCNSINEGEDLDPEKNIKVNRCFNDSYFYFRGSKESQNQQNKFGQFTSYLKAISKNLDGRYQGKDEVVKPKIYNATDDIDSRFTDHIQILIENPASVETLPSE